MDPFASHVMRALLLLLTPSIAPQNEGADVLRSKKSASWKGRQGALKSVFNDKGKGKEASEKASPTEFRAMARKFLTAFRETLSDNELRALSIDKVASPALHVCFTSLLPPANSI